MVITSEDLQQLAVTAEKNNADAFREKLAEASKAFIQSFEAWVEKEALYIAGKGRREARRRYPLSFHEKQDGFRLSSYVKGFRSGSGKEFDTSRYTEIGYDNNQGPFDVACQRLEARGIHVEDISDSSKGLGFWVKISF